MNEYAKHLKKNFYGDNDTRTEEGLYAELQLHYVAYLMGNSHGMDGAYMGKATWQEDSSAVVSEIIGKIIRIKRKAMNGYRIIGGGKIW